MVPFIELGNNGTGTWLEVEGRNIVRSGLAMCRKSNVWIWSSCERRFGDMDLGVVDIFMVMEAWGEDGVAHRSCVDGIKRKDRV